MLATDTYAPPIYSSTAPAALYGLSGIPPLSNPHNPGAFILNPSYPGLLPSAKKHRANMTAEGLYSPERREQKNNIFNSYGDFVLRHTLTSENFVRLLVQNYSQQPIDDITSGLTVFHKTLSQYETELQTQEAVALHSSFECEEREISKANRLKMASHIEALLTATVANDPIAEKVALDNISFLNWLSANYNKYIFLGFRKIADIYI